VNWRVFWFSAVLACASFAQAGGAGLYKLCGTAPVIDIARVQRQINAAQALWQQRGPEEYRLNVAIRGQLGSTTEVQIRRGVVSGLTRLTPPEPSTQGAAEGRTLDAIAAKNYTVPGLFRYVEVLLEALRQPVPKQIPGRAPTRPSPWRPCGVLNVRFDSADGHLRSLRFDYSGSIDEEFTLTVSPVTPLP
jgi:hypothetical protein